VPAASGVPGGAMRVQSLRSRIDPHDVMGHHRKEAATRKPDSAARWPETCTAYDITSLNGSMMNMGRPAITEDQWELAVTMLANALRKDAHLRARADAHDGQGDPLQDSMAKLRSKPSERYVAGMRDLLRILFVDGDVLADAAMEEAYRRAVGMPPTPLRAIDDTRLQ
jgi:hypothetical protein